MLQTCKVGSITLVKSVKAISLATLIILFLLVVHLEGIIESIVHYFAIEVDRISAMILESAATDHLMEVLAQDLEKVLPYFCLFYLMA